MNPSEREELLRENEESSREAADAMREVEKERKNRPVTAGSILKDETVATIVRKHLDPRVVFEAENIGCPPDEIERMKQRMEAFAQEVERTIPNETDEQRTRRLCKRGDELFPEQAPAGCVCGGLGLYLKISERTRRDGSVVEYEFMTVCSCEAGQAKEEYRQAMFGKKRGRGGKDGNLDDVWDKKRKG